MYAIIHNGGKQYRVKEGDKIRVEKLDAEVGQPVYFDQVLMLESEGTVRVGSPMLHDCKVEAQILAHDRAKKILVFKKKRRKGYAKKQGHRQYFTAVQITKIQA